MSNLLKCSRCRQTIIAEAFEAHTCNVPTMQHKSVEAVWSIATKDEKGNDLLLVKALDGTLYTFAMGEKKPSPVMGQLFKSPEDGTEPK